MDFLKSVRAVSVSSPSVESASTEKLVCALSEKVAGRGGNKLLLCLFVLFFSFFFKGNINSSVFKI